jgi:hypothetical protein
LPEFSRRVYYLLYFSFAQEIKRPPPIQSCVRVDKKDVLHPFIVAGKYPQHLIQAWYGSAICELPGRKHMPTFAKGKSH